jgi:hypothetical protein
VKAEYFAYLGLIPQSCLKLRMIASLVPALNQDGLYLCLFQVASQSFSMISELESRSSYSYLDAVEPFEDLAAL